MAHFFGSEAKLLKMSLDVDREILFSQISKHFEFYIKFNNFDINNEVIF